MGCSQKFLIFFSFISASIFCYSQTPQIDSLKHLLGKHKEADSIRVDLLNAYGKAISVFDLEQLKKCSAESEIISNKLDYKKGLAYSYLLQGYLAYKKSDYELSVNFFTTAKKIFESYPKNRGLADTYFGLGLNNFQLASYDNALEFLQKSVNISQEINYKKGISNAYNYIGVCFIHLGKLHDALDILQKSLVLSEETGDNNLKANTYNNIGQVYRDIGDYNNALEYYEKALSIREFLDLKEGLSNSYNSLGIVYELIGDYSKSLEYFNRSLELRQEIGNQSKISGSYNNIGAIYKKTGNYDKALMYSLKALEIKEKLKSKSYLAENLNNIGVIYFLMDKKVEALDYYKRALKESLLLGEKKDEAVSYKNFANLFYSMNNNDSALFYATKGYQLSTNQMSDITLLMDCCLINSKIFESLNDYKKAYKFQSQYKTIYDSIYDADFIGKLKNFELQTQYKNEKEIIIKDLERQRILLHKKQQQMRLMGVIMLVVIITVLLVNYYYRQINQKKHKLFQKNLELAVIESKNEKKTIKIPITIEQETEKDILKQIEKSMLIQKLFKDTTLTLEGLADILNTNRTYLSRIINDNFQCNFNKFVNTYRIKEARKMLSDEEYENLTFEAIAREVGFNSRSVFNKAFKEFTGITPSYFKESFNKQNKNS